MRTAATRLADWPILNALLNSPRGLCVSGTWRRRGDRKLDPCRHGDRVRRLRDADAKLEAACSQRPSTGVNAAHAERRVSGSIETAAKRTGMNLPGIHVRDDPRGVSLLDRRPESGDASSRHVAGRTHTCSFTNYLRAVTCDATGERSVLRYPKGAGACSRTDAVPRSRQHG